MLDSLLAWFFSHDMGVTTPLTFFGTICIGWWARGFASKVHELRKERSDGPRPTALR